MAGQKITEKQQAAVVKTGMNFLITQPEGETGSEKESVRRVQMSAMISALRSFGLLNGYSTTAQMNTILEEFVNVDKASVLMIGDRAQDIDGAKANGLHSAGVLWGYGSAEELRGAGADYLAAEPKELLHIR